MAPLQRSSALLTARPNRSVFLHLWLVARAQPLTLFAFALHLLTGYGRFHDNNQIFNAALTEAESTLLSKQLHYICSVRTTEVRLRTCTHLSSVQRLRLVLFRIWIPLSPVTVLANISIVIVRRGLTQVWLQGSVHTDRIGGSARYLSIIGFSKKADAKAVPDWGAFVYRVPVSTE